MKRIAKQNFKISRKQLEKLISHAGEDAVKAALIQNGSQPTEFNLSRAQLEHLIEHAGEGAVQAALIQNGSTPVDFIGHAKEKE